MGLHSQRREPCTPLDLRDDLGKMFKRKTPYQKGMNALKDKKFGLAKRELLKASDGANNPDAHDKLGIIFYRDGDYDNAQKHFETALAMDPEYGDAMHHMSILYYTTDRRDEALSMCQEACSYLPGVGYANAVPTEWPRIASLSRSDWPAIKQLERALEMAPDSSEARLRLETALDRHGALSYEIGLDAQSNKTSLAPPKKTSPLDSIFKFLGSGCKPPTVSRSEEWADFEPVVNMEGLEDHYA